MLRYLGNGDVIWESKNGTRGAISLALMQSLCSWKQKDASSREAGGVVLGYIDIETNGLLACEFSKPGAGDRRSRNGFFRGKRHQKEIDQWNKSSGGNGTLIGLWHTHPEKSPTPSSTDLNDCSNVLTKGCYSPDGLLYLIVGLEYIGVWFAARKKTLEKLGDIKIQ
ncbi:Mov34/MPN/PAD-1 family protein [uncultured Methylophaga sp.]|uniref:Mov34/MPN/PAD-1 family protein n=1 Tax=uncultured Methylophaga sp. TaxID=285271 RepID=UPI00259CB826|nr:Mov34/MPN/PAD-1 family protein [uncultured Methylophaga sp.]|tara:strand:+ start:37664 stop:38164 length:501 start_codon:yes stop_codon:yes gene_type:complete